jgi:YD repeat-containing protein
MNFVRHKAKEACILAALLFSVGSARAQLNNGVMPYEEYDKKIQASKVVSPLKDDAFGDDIRLYDGTVRFSSVDIDIPGNNALPVRLGRTFDVIDRRSEYFLKGFGDWQIDVPSIYGEFTAEKGWRTQSSSPYARCSIPSKPDSAPTINGITYQAAAELVWHGYHLRTYENDAELLVDDQVKTTQITMPGSYPWITRHQWRVGCLATTANGYPGEGFLAISPNGQRYHFNYAISVPIKPYGVVNNTGVHHQLRVRIHLMVTRIEDRFGNWVTFNYQGDKLSGITSSDGRSIQLTYAGDLIQTASAGGRTWSYQYGSTNAYPSLQGGPQLSQVTMPDTSKWTYSILAGSLLPKREPTEPGALGPGQGGGTPWIPFITVGNYTETGPVNVPGPCRSEPDLRDGNFTFAVGHPSGATATYELWFARMYRGHTPKHICDVPQGTPLPSPYVPHYSDRYKLFRKTVTGPGISPLVWQYQGGSGSVSYFLSGTATTPCPTCVQSKTVTVINPDGTKDVTEFGQLYGLNEGRILSSARQDATGKVVSSTAYSYLSESDVASLPFPSQWGSSLMWLANPLANQLRPKHLRVISMDGVEFKHSVEKTCASNYCFDAFARPLKEKQQGPAFSRTDSKTYHDNSNVWVVGQLASVTNIDTGLVVSENTFSPATAALTSTKNFGRTAISISYNTNGTPSAIADGNGNQTFLSSWKRGVPAQIRHSPTPESPSGATKSAVIDDWGLISSVTDENGFQSSFAYDAMGRLTRITYPTGDEVSYNNWNGEFRQVSAADSKPNGVSAGQWVMKEWEGSRRKFSYLDALWRPVLSYEYDEVASSETMSSVSTSYDSAGRIAFESYPSATTSPPTQGVWFAYDSLGRRTSVSSDSELGLLTTLNEYLPGFITRTTHPRGHKTTTQYQSFGEPTHEFPINIQQPEGAVTEVTRDVFGKPLTITRRSAGAGPSLTRRYVYAADQRLCKTIEPESGATVFDYDGTGNPTKTAAGLTGLSDINNCNREQAWATGRAVLSTYDSLNRLVSTTYPNGIGNQEWTYTPDSNPARITTTNEEAAGGVVVNNYTYNRRRLLIGETSTQSTPASGLVTRSIGYSYSADGHLKRHTYPSGESVDYAPNALGQATRAGSYATLVKYHPDGSLKQFTYGNGLVYTMSQNARGLPRDIKTSGSVIHDRYSYDENGNVSSVLDVQNGGDIGWTTRNRWMEYDGLDRLTAAGSGSFGGDHWHRFTYDAIDNLKSWKLSGVKDYAEYVYGQANQLTNIKNTQGATVAAFEYDQQGNILRKNGRYYNFDYGNRLRAVVNTESYRYDAHGRRALSSSAQGEILSLYDASGVLRRQEDARKGQHTNLIYLDGRLIAKSSVVVAPGIPLLSVPGYTSSGGFVVSWTTVQATSYYELQEMPVSGTWAAVYSGQALSLAINGKLSGSYAYRIRACNPSTCSGWSSTGQVTVELPPASAPTATAPSFGLNGNFTVGWNAVNGATQYELQRNLNNGSWSNIYSGAAVSQAYSAVPQGTYAYRVRACNPAGCSNWSNSASVVVIYAPASAPTPSAPSLSSTGSYVVSWTSIAGATSYQVEESSQGGGWFVVVSAAANSHSLVGKVAGSYAYRATAFNNAGCGPTSGSVTVQVVLPPVAASSINSPPSVSVDTFTVSWSAVATATSYQLDERIGGGAWANIQDAGGTSRLLSGKANSTYAYRVRGCNIGGCGPWSSDTSTVVNVPPPIPNVPTGLSVSKHFDDSTTPGKWVADLNWNASYGATHYDIQEKRGTAAPTTFTVPASPTWHRRANVGATAALTYWVRACSSIGCSSWSAGVSP